MIEDVVVIGDGIAGTAAAWRALGGSLARLVKGPPSARAWLPAEAPPSSSRWVAPVSDGDGGRAWPRVTVVSAGAGASALGSGAIDDVPWEEVKRAARVAGVDPRARPVGAGVAAFVEALGVWRLPAEGEPLPQLATTAGRVRPARGHDRALLDLGLVPEGGVVAVPRVDRAGWDADALAAAWNEDGFVRRRGLRFAALDADLLRFAEEHRVADADLAARHDDPARLAWLSARLREAFSRAGVAPQAVIFGAWLGLVEPRAAELGSLLGMVVGEALSGVGGAAGIRFMHARDRLLAGLGVERVAGRVTRVVSHDEKTGRTSVVVEGVEDALLTDRIVLAAGGLSGGGIVYDPLEIHAGTDLAEKNAPPFRLSFEVEAPLAEQPYLAARGQRVGVASSMFGPDLDRTAWPAPGRPGVLEMVGVACDRAGLAAPYMAVAGDAVADRARTALVAAESGLRAGEWAASN